ncbi:MULTISPECIES: transcriptional regulator [Kitasatospora]|uniref:transcriptional regulator n=1 Tax=Kitasatospora TaxID=2063 RepID=UPI000C705112|nr:transcriptional regulator [Kitasatospora sp. GP30]MDH6139468.1 tetratricopeptide (TPR) repeat protein [Kitasatospora sp. GP30]
MARVKTPNLKLSALLAETRWGLGDFARAVNRLGTETGRRLKYDESAVSHWLSGTRPMAKYQPIVLEALTRKLGRQITAFEAGFADQPDLQPESPDAVVGLVDLGSTDMDPSRRGVLAAGLYSVALTIPDWPDSLSRFARLKTNPHARIGMAEVDSVTAMTERISDLEDQFGGRTARPMAAAFLVNNIAPCLRANASEKVRKAMLSAAADHLYLTGHMAMDERADHLAQRYYVNALELAGAAGDHQAYCTALRGMSVQAVDLRHSQVALRLAGAASSASPTAGPRKRAFLAGQLAHASAQVGNRAEALAHLREAEVAMDHAESRTTVVGSYDWSALAYHKGQVRYELGDRAGAIADLQESARLRGPGNRQTRVRYNSLLAERKLEIGHLEEACADWHQVLDDYPLVQSGRADDRMRAMLTAIGPHIRRNHLARSLYERARPLLAARNVRC